MDVNSEISVSFLVNVIMFPARGNLNCKTKKKLTSLFLLSCCLFFINTSFNSPIFWHNLKQEENVCNGRPYKTATSAQVFAKLAEASSKIKLKCQFSSAMQVAATTRNPAFVRRIFLLQVPVTLSPLSLWTMIFTFSLSGLHNSFHPIIRDGSTWSKFGARGKHGDFLRFSTEVFSISPT